MAQLTPFAQRVLKLRMEKDKSTPEQAAHDIQSDSDRMNKEREKAIQSIKDRLGDPPPKEWQGAIGNEAHLIMLECQWMREFSDPQALLKWKAPTE
jgi:hypothetical protein